jgi:hypothetical protein
MTLPDLSSAVTVAALIIGSCLIAYLNSRRTLARAQEDAREQLELRLEGLTGAIAELEGRVAELTRLNAEVSAGAGRTAAPAAHANGAAQATENHPAAIDLNSVEEIPVEILIVISAAVTSFLGKKVRIRSAKMLQSPYEIVNPWSQQGRVFVQASHASRPRNLPAEPRGRIGPGVRH